MNNELVDLNERITRDLLALTICDSIALRSTCARGQVGCIITYNGRIISSGYNGSPAGKAHCNDIDCNLNEPCKIATHAEANAIKFLEQVNPLLLRISLPLKLYCTHAPCLECAKLIATTSIKRVAFSTSYRNEDGLKFLWSKNIEIVRYDSEQITHHK